MTRVRCRGASGVEECGRVVTRKSETGETVTVESPGLTKRVYKLCTLTCAEHVPFAALNVEKHGWVSAYKTTQLIFERLGARAQSPSEASAPAPS